MVGFAGTVAAGLGFGATAPAMELLLRTIAAAAIKTAQDKNVDLINLSY
jgi:hypothetical protein